MDNRFLFNAVVSSYYDIDTPENYEEFEPQIYLENVDLFSDEIGIDYDRLLDAVQKQLNLEKPEISQVMQHFEDNSNSNSDEYVTIKPDRVLQCTGLKDKNGKLIYEGDIFDKGTRCKWIITWFKNRFILVPDFEYKNKDKCASDRECGFKYFENNHSYADENDEVIGNIYENKELLEKE